MGKSGIKLIDFGSACFANNKEFTYIQSRYYRSPEIVLMKPYDHKIDVWSLGCLIYEIYTGTPLFPSRTEDEQMQMLLSTLGVPPPHFLSVICKLLRNVSELLSLIFLISKVNQLECP
jgi:dual specificity tyrosine-phosphorylation-regulated kinase 2/3/4